MTWDISAARLRVGLSAGDITKDTLLQAAMRVALAVAEKYCDRFFLQQSEVTSFYHTHGNVFQLRRYPIVSVSKITGASGEKVHYTGGWIEYSHPLIVDELKVEYIGGYSTLPVDLEMALWGIFDNIWGDMSGTGRVSTGGVKTVRAGDLSITYDTASGAASSTSGTAMGGYVPAMAKSILDLYHRESC